MRALLLRRLAYFVATLLTASLVIFVLLDLLPGNAAAVLLGTSARPDTIAALQQQLGLDQPAWSRYLSWITGLFSGDLGQSLTYGVPVSGLMAERLVVTLPLALLADAVGLVVAVLVATVRVAQVLAPLTRLHSPAGPFAALVPSWWAMSITMRRMP